MLNLIAGAVGIKLTIFIVVLIIFVLLINYVNTHNLVINAIAIICAVVLGMSIQYQQYTKEYAEAEKLLTELKQESKVIVAEVEATHQTQKTKIEYKVATIKEYIQAEVVPQDHTCTVPEQFILAINRAATNE